MSAPAGWYVDPGNSNLVQYWDGQQWTGQTAPRQAALSQVSYEYKTVTTNAAMVRLLKKGWEVVNSSGRQNWFWGSDLKVVMRRPK